METAHKASWLEGTPGCGIQCRNPIFSKEEHTRIHRFVGGFGALTTLCTLFTIVSVHSLGSPIVPYHSSYAFAIDCDFALAFVSLVPLRQELGNNLWACLSQATVRIGI